MRKITTLLSIVVLSAFSLSLQAQEQQHEQTKVNKSKDNWFISLGGSANLLLAEQDKHQSIGDRLTFGGGLSVGKWFNPNFGSRIQVMGGALKGFNYQVNRGGEVKNRYTQGGDRTRLPYPMGYYPNNNWDKIKLVDDGFWQEFNYGQVGIDIMGNATNLFKGYYSEDNLIDVIPFIGGGYIHAFDNGKTNPRYSGVYIKVGVLVDFNINNNWAIFIEPQATLTSSEFDGYVGDAVGDGIFNLLVGVQYTINKGFYTPEYLTRDEIDYLNNKINENRNLINLQQNQINDLEKCCEDVPAETVVVNIENKYLPEYIRFSLDSHIIQSSEKSKVDEAIEFLKANPESKLLLTGYADRQTGNPSYNLRLSQKRVESVADAFKRAGIPSNRLILEWKGDIEQPYAQNEWNRVVFMVER